VSTRFSSFLTGAEQRLRADSTAIGDALDHGPEKGTGREDSLRRELRLLLPRAFELTTGFVVGTEPAISAQQDVLIYDSMHYPAAEYGNGRHLLVPESLFCAISVRSRLTSSDVGERFDECFALKDLLADALGQQWPGFACLFAFRFEGDWDALQQKFYEMVANTRRGGRLDVICVLDRPLLVDAHAFGLADERRKGFGGMAGTARFFIPQTPRTKGNDTYVIEPSAGPFSGFYQLLLTRLSNTKLLPLRSLTLPRFVEEVFRVQDVMSSQLVAPGGTRLANDSEMTTTCPACGTSQTLAEATVARVADETVYTCRNGCQSIVIVGVPEDVPWEGRGYRLGDRVIRNVADLYMPVVGSPGGVVLPASPAALMRHRPKKA
jgi:uncharacterized protein DUF6602